MEAGGPRSAQKHAHSTERQHTHRAPGSAACCDGRGPLPLLPCIVKGRHRILPASRATERLRGRPDEPTGRSRVPRSAEDGGGGGADAGTFTGLYPLSTDRSARSRILLGSRCTFFVALSRRVRRTAGAVGCAPRARAYVRASRASRLTSSGCQCLVDVPRAPGPGRGVLAPGRRRSRRNRAPPGTPKGEQVDQIEVGELLERCNTASAGVDVCLDRPGVAGSELTCELGAPRGGGRAGRWCRRGAACHWSGPRR